MNPSQQQIDEYGSLFSQVAGPEFEVIGDPDFHHLPYRWKFISRIVTLPAQNVSLSKLF